MPPFFPMIRSGCEEISKEFFDCFDANCEPWGDSAAAGNSLAACKTKMEEYERCTSSSLARETKQAA
jgi:hypothetical protein